MLGFVTYAAIIESAPLYVIPPVGAGVDAALLNGEESATQYLLDAGPSATPAGVVNKYVEGAIVSPIKQVFDWFSKL